MKDEISSTLLERNALPMQQPFFNLSNLIGRQNAKTAQEILGRQCLNPLDEECPPSRNRVGTETSNCEPRVAVVYGITPINARSASPYGMLMTKAGRTFA